MKNTHSNSVLKQWSSGIRTGRVDWFDVQQNRGQLILRDIPFPVCFSLDSQRVIADGVEKPRFTQEAPEKTSVPKCNDPVAVALRAYYSRSEHDTGNYHVKRLELVVLVTGWNFFGEYRASERRIANRDEYRVVVFTSLNGVENQNFTVMPNSSGTAEQLQARSPRGSAEDEFAPTYQSGKFIDRRQWQKRTKGTEMWTNCNDPRPEPAQPLIQVPQVEDISSKPEPAVATPIVLTTTNIVSTATSLLSQKPVRGEREGKYAFNKRLKAWRALQAEVEIRTRFVKENGEPTARSAYRPTELVEV